jgi:hypothetical protein
LKGSKGSRLCENAVLDRKFSEGGAKITGLDAFAPSPLELARQREAFQASLIARIVGCTPRMAITRLRL